MKNLLILVKVSIISIGTFYLLACSSSKKTEDPPQKIETPKKQTLTPEQAAPALTNVVKEATQWSYSGLTGPDMWGDLKSEYSLCKSGKSQSPIDLVWRKPLTGGKIVFDYKQSNYQIIDNGHTVRAIFEPGNKVQIHGNEFELVEVHFHAKSEHTISGKHFPLEAHFINQNAKGEIAKISVMFVEGKKNPYLDTMWNQFPREKNRSIASTVQFNPQSLVPEKLTHYHYSGSLTIPPCTEGVDWFVLNTPVEMSKDQIDHFRVLYTDNFRPIQKLNGRAVVNF